MPVGFALFARERQYLSNVSPATLEWYKYSFKWLHTETPSADDLKDAVMRMRAKGLRATGCNSAIRAINAYVKWAGILRADGAPLKIPQLKEPQLILPTFTATQILQLVNWKPRGFCQHRLHILVLLLADTGCRISEALGLQWSDADLDNLLLKIHGKGGKDRIVPFSCELRRHLWGWRKQCQWDLVFSSRQGQRLGRRNALRDVKMLCRDLGFEPPARTLHAFRHSFAVNYIRRGGSVFHLQRCLGHSSLEMTRRYVALTTADLSAVHERLSLLSAR